MVTMAKKAANRKYDSKTYEYISTRSRKEDRRSELIAIAASRQGIGSALYIRQAIDAALDRDGIGPDDLPPIDDTTT